MEIGIFGGLVGDRNGKEMEQITWKRSIVKHSCKPKIYLMKYWICNLRKWYILSPQLSDDYITTTNSCIKYQELRRYDQH